MKAPSKQLLIHADGTVEEYKGEPIAGVRFHVPFMKDGDHWERVFKMEWAATTDHLGPDDCYTIVGVEESCTMQRSAQRIRQDDEENRTRVLSECLRGIRGEA